MKKIIIFSIIFSITISVFYFSYKVVEAACTASYSATDSCADSGLSCRYGKHCDGNTLYQRYLRIKIDCTESYEWILQQNCCSPSCLVRLIDGVNPGWTGNECSAESPPIFWSYYCEGNNVMGNYTIYQCSLGCFSDIKPWDGPLYTGCSPRSSTSNGGSQLFKTCPYGCLNGNCVEGSCGNNKKEGSEECDGTDSATCPGKCGLSTDPDPAKRCKCLCTTDADCPSSDHFSCTNSNTLLIKGYCGDDGKCIDKSISCGPSGPVMPFRYACGGIYPPADLGSYPYSTAPLFVARLWELKYCQDWDEECKPEISPGSGVCSGVIVGGQTYGASSGTCAIDLKRCPSSAPCFCPCASSGTYYNNTIDCRGTNNENCYLTGRTRCNVAAGGTLEEETICPGCDSSVPELEEHTCRKDLSFWKVKNECGNKCVATGEKKCMTKSGEDGYEYIAERYDCTSCETINADNAICKHTDDWREIQRCASLGAVSFCSGRDIYQYIAGCDGECGIVDGTAKCLSDCPSALTYIGTCSPYCCSGVNTGLTCSGSCLPFSVQPCGNGGTQTCNFACGWGLCQNEGQCQPGETKPCGCGGTQTCTANQWSSCSAHNECQGNKCVCVGTPGNDSCNNDNDCSVPTKHNECVAEKCVLVSGPGNNLCADDNSCSSDAVINGVCGSAVKNYSVGSTSFGTDTLCSTTHINKGMDYMAYSTDLLARAAYVSSDATITPGPNVVPTMTAGTNPGDNNVTPIMTSNTAPIPNVASATNEYSVSYAAYKAFDNNNATYWATPVGVSSGKLELYYGAGNAKKIVRYSIYPYASYEPTSWTFEGSNDNTNWTTLNNQSGVSWIGVVKTFSFSNPNNYLYYRLNITSSNGTTVDIYEMKFFDTATNPSASATSEYSSDYQAYKAFDNNNATYWATTVGVSSGKLELDYGSGNSKKVIRYSIYPYTGYQPANWTFEGSNNNTSWTVLDTRSGLSWTAGETKTFDFSNSTSYRYYRLNITSSNGTTVNIYEMKMFEGASGGNLQVWSEGTIKSQGSNSLKGIAVITNSANDTLTRTIATPIDLTGMDTLKFDIYSSRTGSNIKMGVHDTGGTTTEITPNITSVGAWQTVTWDISGISVENKNAIDKIIITIVDASAENTFYIDNFYAITIASAGIPTPVSPAINITFPNAAPYTTSWVCNGSNGGTNSSTCTATLAVNGSCGTAAKTYPVGSTAFTGTICDAGTPNPASPTFPTASVPTTWICNALNEPVNPVNPTCTATLSVPQVTATSLIFSSNYCVPLQSGNGLYTFQWIYSDLSSRFQNKFDFQVDNNSDFSSPVVIKTFSVDKPSGETNTQSVFVRLIPVGDDLGYNTIYYWRVKVYNSGGDSGWVVGSSFTTGPHPFPYPAFTPPSNPIVNEAIVFTDSFQCYGTSCTSTWNFGGGTGPASGHSYPGVGGYTVKLTVCNEHNQCCDVSRGITVSALTGQNPEWREIPPF